MSNLPRIVKKNLTDVLKEDGLLKEEILQQAVARQKQTSHPMHRIIHAMGVLTEHELARSVSKQLGLPYLDASSYHVPNDVVGVVDVGLQESNQMVHLDRIGKSLVIAAAGPPPPEVIEQIEKATGGIIFFYISTVAQIEASLAKYHKNGQAQK